MATATAEWTHEQRAKVDRFVAEWDPIKDGPPLRLRDLEPAFEVAAVSSATPDHRLVDGGKFVLDGPEKVPAIWGRGDEVLWPEGEPFLLVGPDGVGKGTLAQQLALGLVGVPRYGKFLDQPVNIASDGVLYVAADRPNQIARSFRRMVQEDDRPLLSASLSVWRGPLPFDFAAEPDKLTPWLREREVGAVVFDSLGALISDPASDETGSGVFRALTEATSAGFDVCALYHPRKAEQSATKRVQTIADVYGSRWITAGAGSVLYLDGQPGDIIIHARHLKQPAGEVGPLTIRHDHDRGHSELFETPDLLELAGSGISVKNAASSLFEATEPTANEIEKARRRLDKLADRGDLERSGGTGEPTIYRRVQP